MRLVRASTGSSGRRVVIDPSLSCGSCDRCLREEITQCDELGILGSTTPTFAEYARSPPATFSQASGLSWEVAGRWAGHRRLSA